MRDAVELEKRGVPTATFVLDSFEQAARTQARLLGMPDLPLVVVHYYTRKGDPWLTDEERRRMMEASLPTVVAGLAKPARLPAR